MKKNGYSPVARTVIKAPPTPEMRKRVAKIVQARRPKDEDQFIDEVRMLGLEDLIAI
jgi:hypothetical protein